MNQNAKSRLAQRAPDPKQLHGLPYHAEAARRLVDDLNNDASDTPELIQAVIASETDLLEAIDEAWFREMELKATAEALKACEERIAERRKSFERRAKKVRQSIFTAMRQAMGANGKFPFTLRPAWITATLSKRAGKLVVTDASVLPEKYLKQPPKVPDKEKIGEDLANTPTDQLPLGIDRSNDEITLTIR